MKDSILTILSLVWAAILVLVGGRFIALVAGANQDSRLIQRLYDWSDFWVSPFFGIAGMANEAVQNTGGVFEPASLVAFAVYFLAGALILNLLRGPAFVDWRRWRHA